MAESLGSVLLSLGVDLDQFNAGLQQAEKLAAEAGKKISNRLDARRATLSALEQKLSTLESKLKTSPWSAEALEAPIRALKSEIALRKQSIALLEQQIGKQQQPIRNPRGQKPDLGENDGASGGIAASLKNFAALLAGAAATQQIIAVGQESQKSKILLEALAGAYGEVAVAQESVSRIQASLNTSTIEARTGYSQLYAALRGTGISAEQLEVLYVGLNKAARLSGAGSQEAAGALLQLKQGLSSGVLAGDELRSVLEAMPALTQQLAKELGVSVGQIKKLGSEGKITSDVVFNAAKSLAASQAPAKTATEELAIAFKNLQEQIAQSVGPAATQVVIQLAAGVKVIGAAFVAAEGPIRNVALGILEFGRGIAPLVIGIYAVRKAMLLWELASKGLAASQAFLISLTGPKGWAYVAGAAVAAGLAYAALDKVTRDVAAGIGKINAEAKKAEAEFQALLKSVPNLTPKIDTAQLKQVTDAGRLAVADAQQQYNETLKLSKLKGDVKDIAAEQFKIDKALAAEARAYVEAYQAAQGKDPIKAQKLQDAAAVASINLRTAMVEGAKAIKESAENAKERFAEASKALKSAFDAQDNARVSAFDVITPQAQQETRNRLIGKVQEGVGAGQLDPNKIRQVYGPDLDTLDIGKLADLAGKSASLIDAQDGIISASKELKAATDNLAGVNALLAEKDWAVNVRVNADGSSAAYGDVLNRAI